MTDSPESDELEILSLNVFQSVEERYPSAPVPACVIASVLLENVSGEETVVFTTCPLELVERS